MLLPYAVRRQPFAEFPLADTVNVTGTGFIEISRPVG